MKSLLSIFLLGLCLVFSNCHKKEKLKREADKDWPVYLGGYSSAQYSPLDQINKENVSKLEVAWEFKAGDADTAGGTQIQCNPLIIEGILYGTSPKLKVFALDAASGKKLWMFNPNADVNFAMNVNRGLAYWEDGDNKRILFTAGPELFCLNAVTGEIIKDFGNNGKVSLKKGLGDWAKDLYVVSTSPGIVYNDILIIGTRVSENADAAPGYIRAFNIRTGEVEWIFHTIPRPGEFGYETWPEDAFKHNGGVNSWSGLSLDKKRGIVFVPTGSASFDFWGGNRKGQNLFANCVLALDAKTGKRIWHYQTVHHDIWDRDVPAPPNLVTVTHNGKATEAIAQITKSGLIFLLDRQTGEPLFPVEERKVEDSDLDGEEAWATQPIPVKPPPFSRQRFTAEDISDVTPNDHDSLVQVVESMRTGEPFIPPSEQGTIIFPGYDGGGEWGGASVDPAKGIMYVNAREIPSIIKMERSNTQNLSGGAAVYQSTCATCHGKEREGNEQGDYPALKEIGNKYEKKELLQIVENGKGFMPAFAYLEDVQKAAVVDFLLNIKSDVVDPHELGKESNKESIPYMHAGYSRLYDSQGYPAVKPPWGTLTAIDLNQGTIEWQVPLGEYKELTDRGIPKTGTGNYGGPVNTAGGIIFIAASKDEHIRAFDKDTGEEIWKYKLPAAGYATPSIYEVNGKQYVVIACGGGKMGTQSGDSYLAFSLP